VAALRRSVGNLRGKAGKVDSNRWLRSGLPSRANREPDIQSGRHQAGDISVRRGNSRQRDTRAADDAPCADDCLRAEHTLTLEASLNGAVSRSNVTGEQVEISRLRAKLARAPMECEILERALGYFIKRQQRVHQTQQSA
jgi:hypothetical protein